MRSAKATIERQRPLAGGRSKSNGLAGALRRWAADEAGGVSIEYLMVSLLAGLIAAIALIAAIGPTLVSMWSDQRACLYDDICVSPSPR